MKYLIDTDISSFYLRGRYNLCDTFKKKGFQNIKLSRIAFAEMAVLAYKKPHSKINLSAINSLANDVGVLEVDKDIWQIYSMLKADVLKRGAIRGDLDILIASTAKRYKMTVVTNNTKHYEDLVQVENWIDKNNPMNC